MPRNRNYGNRQEGRSIAGVLEIERKFLVKQIPGDLGRYPYTQIVQGYLAEDPHGTQVRLRKTDDRHWLTVKHRCGENARIEHEVPLSSDWWTRLWQLTEGRRLRKTRFNVPFNGFTIEVDVFSGANAGYIIAEVEFPDEETARAFEPPDWLGDDVTRDPSHSNRRRAIE
jgi:adenylate cyclase